MAPLIPRELLFGNPLKSNPQVSPDGRRLAYTAPVESVLNVLVGDLGSEDFKPLTHDTDRGIHSYRWAPDGDHLLYLQDQNGNENHRLHRVNISTGEDVDLTPFDGIQARIMRADKHHPHQILVGINRRDRKFHDVYRLDISAAELELIFENTRFTGSLLADWDFEVRAGTVTNPDGSTDLLVRDKGGDWRLLLKWEADDTFGSSPLAFSRDGTRLFCLSSAGAETLGLVSVDVATGAETVVHREPDHDLLSATFDQNTGEPIGAAGYRERLNHTVLDPAWKATYENLRKIHHGEVTVASRDHSDRALIVRTHADDSPPAYYSFDRTTGESQLLFESQPGLAAYEKARTEPFKFQAGDGLSVHGYVTFPKGVERTDLPTVLYVHGGPWARDTWGWNGANQWLADRGYLVVQVNYRGSLGYGRAFSNAGTREWAGKMHTDLINAVDFVVAQGWADRERVAIYGGSYGGYAALVGATFTPDVFRCAVELCGPSNIQTLIESFPPYWVAAAIRFRLRAGDPETEPDFCWSRSPLSRVNDIKIPMMIVQGGADPRVTQVEAEQIVDAMKANGIPHTYLLFPDEGHGLVKPHNREKFYGEMELFLAEHLGGAAQ